MTPKHEAVLEEQLERIQEAVRYYWEGLLSLSEMKEKVQYETALLIESCSQ